jgi:hypothetical protein
MRRNSGDISTFGARVIAIRKISQYECIVLCVERIWVALFRWHRPAAHSSVGDRRSKRDRKTPAGNILPFSEEQIVPAEGTTTRHKKLAAHPVYTPKLYCYTQCSPLRNTYLSIYLYIIKPNAPQEGIDLVLQLWLLLSRRHLALRCSCEISSGCMLLMYRRWNVTPHVRKEKKKLSPYLA